MPTIVFAMATEVDSLVADLDLALQLADAADAISMDRFGASDLKVDTKPDLTPVTEADRAVEQRIRGLLAQFRPDDAVIGEEFGDKQIPTGRAWVIDPIDATKNYVRRVPVWATLIGLLVDGSPVMGVVSAPALGRRWWATEGGGAWVTVLGAAPRRIEVSSVQQLADASFSFSEQDGWAQAGIGGGLQALIDACWRMRAYGDYYSHMLVAEGAVDVAVEPSLKSWDMAALIPIVREAGGTITGPAGGDPLTEGCAVTTNSVLHQQVLDLL